jgi:hypothetical protein
MDSPLRGVWIVKGEPTLVTRDNDGEIVRRHALSQWQPFLAFLDSCGSELFGQLVGNPRQMKTV